MEDIIVQILERLRAGETVDDRALVKLVHAAARRSGADKRAFAKRRLLPFYQRVKTEDPERWRRWGVDEELERELLQVLRMKPRRSASGVATITVITKPWPCSGGCIFCPNDVRAPKSYLRDEPACARAEQNCFDPYLQVSARLTALSQMGHATDKIELIVLGGTWSDYPQTYRIWFMRELFRALNDDAVAGAAANPVLRGFAADGDAGKAAVSAGPVPEPAGAPAPGRDEADAVPASVRTRRQLYRDLGLLPEAWSDERRAALEHAQGELDGRRATYNEAFARTYGSDAAWKLLEQRQRSTFEELEREQRANERARHRVVGLVIETRPDAITPSRLVEIRRMGATKIQMGVQSLDQRVLDASHRGTTVDEIARAFALLRLFGFKIHAHAMVNLLGATPAGDTRDYARLVADGRFCPDEVKLYPCALIEGAALNEQYESGAWRPYTEDELVDVLCADVAATPAFCRVSRMIRDFSTGDIKAGNKKPNLRQLVERRLAADERAGAPPVREIRYREVATDVVDLSALALDEVAYETAAASERFLQWVTPQGKIAGFLRLSLPHGDALAALAEELADAGIACPIAPGEAMIREVHIYGMAARVGEGGVAAQHHGLGRRLVERACQIARAAGYARLNVISAVGTRDYYRGLGFIDHGLYQQRDLLDDDRGASC